MHNPLLEVIRVRVMLSLPSCCRGNALEHLSVCWHSLGPKLTPKPG